MGFLRALERSLGIDGPARCGGWERDHRCGPPAATFAERLRRLLGCRVRVVTEAGARRGRLVAVASDYIVLRGRGKRFIIQLANIVWVRRIRSRRRCRCRCRCKRRCLCL